MPILARISVHVDGEGMREFVVQARKACDDLRPAFRQVALNLARLEGEVFDSQGARLGRPWQPLTESTRTARARGWGYYRQPSTEGPARRILHWTRRLRTSLTNPTHPEHIAEVTTHGLRFGTRVPYGIYHNSPASRRSTLPRRQFLGLPDDFVKANVVAPIAQFLMGRDPANGRGQRKSRRVPRAYSARSEMAAD